jgi:hypothetical protein
MSTNGSEPKALESTRWSNSEEVRHRFGGYRTISAVKLLRECFYERVKQFPCTVHTGQQHEFRSGSGHRSNVSCFPKDHTFESLLTEIHEATFAEALPRQDAGAELAQNPTLPEP